MIPPFPSRLSLASLPTEFRCLQRASKEIGGPRIWLKSDDRTGNLLSGNKVRKLEFLMADAEAKGCDTVITCGGLQSNHCRATAAVAARLGIRCQLILRGPRELAPSDKPYTIDQVTSFLDGNLLLDQLCGAHIEVYSPAYYTQNLSRIFEDTARAMSEEGLRPYQIPTGGSNECGLWGYIQAAQELQEDCKREGINPGAVICATGSGGTQGGLTLGCHLLDMPNKVIGVAVCDSKHYFEEKIRGDVEKWQSAFLADQPGLSQDISIHTLEDYIGPGYAQGYPELFQCIDWLAKTEGVILDPVYTGKAFYGMVQQIRNGQMDGCDDVVFVHTGGLFGVFPYRNEFSH